ncbi:MAG: hypothetical protein JWN92_1414, partial [Candidatus Acidoferrum typicum]|nr:hypothetical protein [Candidatus Acidoferrum typicum]
MSDPIATEVIDGVVTETESSGFV